MKTSNSYVDSSSALGDWRNPSFVSNLYWKRCLPLCLALPGEKLRPGFFRASPDSWYWGSRHGFQLLWASDESRKCMCLKGEMEKYTMTSFMLHWLLCSIILRLKCPGFFYVFKWIIRQKNSIKVIPCIDFPVIYYITGSAVALFPVTPCIPLSNLISSVKPMHDCIMLIFGISK